MPRMAWPRRDWPAWGHSSHQSGSAGLQQKFEPSVCCRRPAEGREPAHGAQHRSQQLQPPRAAHGEAWLHWARSQVPEPRAQRAHVLAAPGGRLLLSVRTLLLRHRCCILHMCSQVRGCHEQRAALCSLNTVKAKLCMQSCAFDCQALMGCLMPASGCSAERRCMLCSCSICACW